MKQIKGHYIWGHEVNTFTPCGASKTYWVSGQQSTLKELESKYQSLTNSAYEKTYATITGEVLPKDPNSDGHDSDYDGLLNLESVDSISQVQESDCK